MIILRVSYWRDGKLMIGVISLKCAMKYTVLFRSDLISCNCMVMFSIFWM